MGCNGGCNRNPCACNVVPLPYYEDDCYQQNQSQGCKVINTFSPVLRISTAWAVPNYDVIISLKVPALSDIMIGSVISNPDFGDYQIVSYEQEWGIIKVTKMIYNTVEAGIVIPSCTKFIVVSNLYGNLAAQLEDIENYLAGLSFQTVEAAGSNQSDAASITGTTVQVTGADNTKGGRLKVYNIGTTVYLYNDSTDSLEVYPPLGGEINGLGINQPLTLSGGTLAIIVTYPSNKYIVNV